MIDIAQKRILTALIIFLMGTLVGGVVCTTLSYINDYSDGLKMSEVQNDIRNGGLR